MLSGVLDEADIACLAGVPHTFPAVARDPRGRWRQVLADSGAQSRSGDCAGRLASRTPL
ncbi:hypothetical protein GCM10010121_093810 [Streptomyces brasiliensis]|uniref:Uncharacterized protein n=1 Tax=Streptomyces brasiliensis TaxID=1954 RepID=A0A917PA47_9ACTN|nr:hypothetical protein GCM10010121_093810 [Streptomyces brasiliensis]